MANAAGPSNPQAAVGAIHDDKSLCQRLLRSISASAKLEILPSTIHDIGTGLFAKKAIPEGTEIFRSTPLVRCVGEGLHDIICDFCFAGSARMIHGEVNFTTEGKEIPKIYLCKECELCGYCSEDCRDQAFKNYHRLECSAIKSLPSEGTGARMLYRLLAMYEGGSLKEPELRALRYLCDHPETNPLHISHDKIIATAANAKIVMELDLGHEEIQNLFRKILANAKDMEYPREGIPGMALDLVSSFANHSCDPNAYVFFERSQLRMRSLKPIKAGDEITHSYLDIKNGVTIRREFLQSWYSFTCNCNKCEKDHRDLKALALSEGLSVKDITETEREFIHLWTQPDSYELTDQVENTIAHITEKVFPSRPWPDTLHPMGEMKLFFAGIYFKSNNYYQAVIHALQGCLARATRSGWGWVDALDTLAMCLTHLMIAPDTAGSDIPDPQNLWNFTYGILHVLRVHTGKVFGVDSRYTIAIYKWYEDTLRYADAPRPGEVGFAAIFEAAQTKMLEWAGVDKSLAIVFLEG